MDAVSRDRRTAVRAARALACALALAAAGAGVLTSSGQARDRAAGGAPRSQPIGTAGAAASTASVGGSRPRGLSRAGEAWRAGTLLEQRPPASALLERCVAASSQIERYATFAGRMVALPGTSEMAMRIDVEERMPGQSAFHRLEGAGALGLGAWRTSEPGVKIFKDLKQVSNLDAPVEYRAIVRFRWVGAKGAIVRREILRTPACRQPAPEGQVGGEAPTARMPGR